MIIEVVVLLLFACCFVLCRCWSADPAQRPSVDMLLDCLALMIQDRQQQAA
jgi:hypothetical protein